MQRQYKDGATAFRETDDMRFVVVRKIIARNALHAEQMHCRAEDALETRSTHAHA